PRGQRRLRIARDGALMLELAGGTLREAPPVSYQAGAAGRRPVASRFVRRADGTIGVRVGRYDHSRPLTIDPTLTYSSFLGGPSTDVANAIAVDGSGAAYVTGTTASTSFPTSAGAFSADNAGAQDAFVTKLTPSGSARAYSTYLGGSSVDIAYGVAVDAAGAAYVTGTTGSANFPTTAGVPQPAFGGGNSDAFVTKLAPSGASLVYSTFLGGTGADTGYGIAVNSAGEAFVAGQAATGFPTTAGAEQTALAGGTYDAFATKISATGASLAYSTYLGGNDVDIGSGVAVDGSGSAYVTGETVSTNFPTTAGAAQTSFGGGSDAFVTKLSITGTALSYSTYLGGSDLEYGYGIAVDSSGSAYTTGYTYSTDFPTTAGAAQTTYGGGLEDAFVTKLAPTGASRIYSTFLGGTSGDVGRAVAVDAAGTASVVGQTSSTDFPTTAGAVQPVFGGGAGNAFVAQIARAGDRQAYGSFLSGSSGSAGLGVAEDASGVYLTGSTGSSNFPTTPGAAQTASGGATDAFVTKLVPDLSTGGTPTTPTTPVSTDTTPAPPPPPLGARPRIYVFSRTVTWNRVAIRYRVTGAAAALLQVRNPATKRLVTVDLHSGAKGTLHWNRRLGGRKAPLGSYRLQLTASSGSRSTIKPVTVSLDALYAHAPRALRSGIAVPYELAVTARVSLTVTPRGGKPSVVARRSGHVGHNRITWNRRLHGRPVAGGAYRLTITATTAGGTKVRAVIGGS
ncbi:MAG: uncharacterized protein JWM71_2345, partial [Solirubrobacteraceae bacterium]|nr:uncharacterized protein [Solirubrobacteraceae bacterium]